MNSKLKMVYLKGADQYFGPNQGSSTVFINTRKNYSQDCPEVAHFLNNFKMTIEMENALMSMILDQKLDPKVAAQKWIKDHSKSVQSWMSGVKSHDGQLGYEVVRKKLL